MDDFATAAFGFGAIESAISTNIFLTHSQSLTTNESRFRGKSSRSFAPLSHETATELSDTSKCSSRTISIPLCEGALMLTCSPPPPSGCCDGVGFTKIHPDQWKLKEYTAVEGGYQFLKHNLDSFLE